MSIDEDRTPAVAIAAEILRGEMVCHEHTLLELLVPAATRPEPGQFLQIRCADDEDEAARVVEWDARTLPVLTGGTLTGDEPLLRRPLSIADHWRDADGDHFQIISRAVGSGTRWLERARVGETLDITGPLGRGFRIPDKPATAVLLGGGVGIPPLLFLARRLNEAGWSDVTLILGATTRDLLPLSIVGEAARAATPRPCVRLPGQADFGTILTTDDGSLGLAGRVTDPLEQWLAHRAAGDMPPLVCACGPEPMLRGVAEMTRAHNLECQLCIERVMGCGMGTCLSCVVRVRDESQSVGWRWGLTCTDGPVFERDQLIDMSPSA